MRRATTPSDFHGQRDERMANLTQTWLLHFLQQPLNMVLLKEKHRCTKWLSTTLDMIISERRVDIFTLGSLRSRRATP